MKAVIMSVQPEWVQKIIARKKSFEIRKTKPNLPTPFKVYVYCTYGEGLIEAYDEINPNALIGIKVNRNETWGNCCNGKVVCEFICDAIVVDKTFGHDPLLYTAACMDAADIAAYCVNAEMYGWHISDLKIYDKPKELREFTRYGDEDIRPCQKNPYFLCQHEYYDYSEDCNACNIDFDGTACPYIKVNRPPQSWCYVEELEN